MIFAKTRTCMDNCTNFISSKLSKRMRLWTKSYTIYTPTQSIHIFFHKNKYLHIIFHIFTTTYNDNHTFFHEKNKKKSVSKKRYNPHTNFQPIIFFSRVLKKICISLTEKHGKSASIFREYNKKIVHPLYALAIILKEKPLTIHRWMIFYCNR